MCTKRGREGKTERERRSKCEELERGAKDAEQGGEKCVVRCVSWVIFSERKMRTNSKKQKKERQEITKGEVKKRKRCKSDHANKVF